ncbi:MAG TPA: four helix bundle protein [Anaerolineae bacterium]|nr:four helix bundle protein [Anaerolineae bacterium]HQK15212.1 four helix bundle protein [Anaerolineae bacterium]
MGVTKVESYRDLEIFELGFALAVEADLVTKSLPKHELYEEGSQLRRSAKSIPANIAEGFGRRRYKQEYIRFIVFALASCDETRVHLDLLYRTGSLAEDTYQHLTEQYDILGKKINRFLQGVIEHHQEPYR